MKGKKFDVAFKQEAFILNKSGKAIDNMVSPRNKIRNQFAAAISLFLILILIRDMVGVKVPLMGYTLVAGITLLFLDSDEIIGYVMFLLPFTIGIQSSYILGVALIIYLTRKGLAVNGLILPAIILIAYELMHFVIPPFDFFNYLRYEISFIFLAVVTLNKPGHSLNNVLILKSFVFGVIASVMDIVFQTLKDFSFSIAAMVSSGLRVGRTDLISENDINSLTNNQNAIGFFCVVAISVLLVLFIAKRIKTNIFVFANCFLVFGGLLTISRTFIVTLSVTLSLFILIGMKNNKRLRKNVLFIIAFGLILFTTLSQLYPEAIQNIANRFSEEDSYGTYTGSREYIFNYYNQALLSNIGYFLFGVGMETPHLKLNSELEPHNSIQEIYVSWGFIGTILVIWMFYNIYINATNNTLKENRRCYELPGFTIFIFSLASHLMGDKIFLLFPIIAFCSIRLNNLYGKSGQLS